MISHTVTPLLLLLHYSKSYRRPTTVWVAVSIGGRKQGRDCKLGWPLCASGLELIGGGVTTCYGHDALFVAIVEDDKSLLARCPIELGQHQAHDARAEAAADLDLHTWAAIARVALHHLLQCGLGRVLQR